MKPLCIYHSNCFDGFSSAWAVREALGDDVEFFPGTYGKPPPADLEGRDIIIVDFSYPRTTLEAMARVANSVVVLDHHKSAKEDLAGLRAPPLYWMAWQIFTHKLAGLQPEDNLCALFDMERSGAGIAWDFFHPGKPRPMLLNYVEDRDLWRFKLLESRLVHAGLSANPFDFQTWSELMHGGDPVIGRLVDDGQAIERKHQLDIANLLPISTRTMRIAGYTVPVANVPITMCSDAGNRMAQDRVTFAATYFDGPNGRVFSLRSAENGIDVSEVAKVYGGGGHMRAAGFTIPFARLADEELL